MEQIDIKDTPANATNLKTDDGRIFRVYTKVLTPEADIPTAQMLQVQTHGYEIDKTGAFMVDDNNEPIMMEKQVTSVPLENIRNGSDTMNGGWVATDLAYDPKDPREDVKDVRQLKALPKTGAPGDRVYSKETGETYVYSPGQYATIRASRVSDFAARTRSTPDAPTVDVSDILPK